MSLDLLGSAKKCLVIAAHPDDEVLGVGGTIINLVQQGVEVAILHVTGGKGGRVIEYDTNAIKDEQAILIQEIKKVVEYLDVKNYTRLDFPDNRLDTISRMDLSLKITEFAESFNPDIVFTHHYGDYNWDHTIVYEATLMSFRANFGDQYPNALLSYEVLSSSERSSQNPNSIFCPNFFVDISASIENKKEALALYQSELRQYPHPRSKQAVEYLARKRGQEVGWEMAEAFQVIRLLQK